MTRSPLTPQGLPTPAPSGIFHHRPPRHAFFLPSRCVTPTNQDMPKIPYIGTDIVVVKVTYPTVSIPQSLASSHTHFRSPPSKIAKMPSNKMLHLHASSAKNATYRCPIVIRSNLKQTLLLLCDRPLCTTTSSTTIIERQQTYNIHQSATKSKLYTHLI